MNYATLLDGVLATNGITHQGRDAYLAQLAQPSADVWRGYQNQTVAVDYSRFTTQEAYLLRYYWPYSFLVETVLDICGVEVQAPSQETTASFFGCGPGPELLSLVRHLARRGESRVRINAWMFDLLARQWGHSRGIVESHLLPTMWEAENLAVNSVSVCIGSQSAFADPRISRVLAISQLVTFQNCLNELNGDQLLRARENIRVALATLPIGASMVLIERSGYRGTADFLESLVALLSSDSSYRVQARLGEEFDAREVKREILASPANQIFGDTDWHRNQGLQLSPVIRCQWALATRVAH